MRAGPPGRTKDERTTSTEPLDVNRATNSTERRVPACPEAVRWRQELLEAGFNVRLRNVERALNTYNEIYAEGHPDNGGFLAYLMTYLDPTGEEAVREVMAG